MNVVVRCMERARAVDVSYVLNTGKHNHLGKPTHFNRP